jgi:hypothetical protein
MGILADAALTAGGEVIGVIPRRMIARELGHAGVTSLIPVNSIANRQPGSGHGPGKAPGSLSGTPWVEQDGVLCETSGVVSLSVLTGSWLRGRFSKLSRPFSLPGGPALIRSIHEMRQQ